MSAVLWLCVCVCVRISVQFRSVAQLCSTLCHPIDCSTPGLPELAQTHVHGVGDAIQPSHPLSSPCPPALIFPSIRVFSSESALRMRWPKYWTGGVFSCAPLFVTPCAIAGQVLLSME